MQQMVETAKNQTLEHGKTEGFTEEQALELYNQLSLGALKYFILKVDPKKNMLFNPEESIDFNGNTGPFIQYTHARACSIIRKSGESELKLEENVSFNEKELEVIKTLHSFGAVVQQAGKTYSPALIANYVYELAKNFNTFYQDTPILKEEDVKLKNMRLCLTYFTANTIKIAMSLLGIQVPERM
jgi:arginyl-tRNA synthetase